MDPLTLAGLVAGLALLAVLSVAAGALDLYGAVASFVMGLVIALIGGIDWLLVLLSFTAIGFLATRFGRKRKVLSGNMEGYDGRRGWTNVVGNGGAAVLAAFAVLVVSEGPAALAFATAVAAVSADTLASEIGTFSRRPRMILPPFRQVRAGTDGAVSWLGQMAALGAAATIGLIATLLLAIPWHLSWVPVLFGFAGCQLDSVLGATLEARHDRIGPLSKADVNFLASAVPAFIVLVAATLL